MEVRAAQQGAGGIPKVLCLQFSRAGEGLGPLLYSCLSISSPQTSLASLSLEHRADEGISPH